MAEPNADHEMLRWAVGLVATAATAAFGWLWQRINGLEVRQDKTVTERTGEIWAAISEDRKQAMAFRERTLERLGEMPTKRDLEAMEARLVDRLDRHPTR